MAELGAGGGYGDTEQSRVELEIADIAVISSLMELCKDELAEHPEVTKLVVDMLSSISKTLNTPLILERKDYDEQDPDDLDAKGLLQVLARKAQREHKMKAIIEPTTGSSLSIALPSRIRFPYSRHSSYNELCLLIKAFKPKDIFPCTVNERGWIVAHSMSFMFGHLYDAPLLCRHDQYMLARDPKPSTKKTSKRTHSDDFSTSNAQLPADRVTNNQAPATEKVGLSEPSPNCDSAFQATNHITHNKKARTDDQTPSGSEAFHSAPENLENIPSTSTHQPIASNITPHPLPTASPSGADSAQKDKSMPSARSNHESDIPTRDESVSSDTASITAAEEDPQSPSLDPILVELALRSEAYQAVFRSSQATTYWYDMNLISMGHHSDSDREL
jgi:hypothetical protein